MRPRTSRAAFAGEEADLLFFQAAHTNMFLALAAGALDVARLNEAGAGGEGVTLAPPIGQKGTMPQRLP